MRDEKIRDKINSLTDLPAGYQPSLESKWALLETATEERERKPVVPVFRMAAAVALLLCSLIGWQYWNQGQTEGELVAEETAISLPEEAVAMPERLAKVPAPPAPQKEVRKKKEKAQLLAIESSPAQVVQQVQPLIITDSQPDKEILHAPALPLTQSQAEKAAPKRKKRFVEVTFREDPKPNVATAEPEAPTTSFRFRLQPSSPDKGGSEEGVLKLKTPL